MGSFPRVFVAPALLALFGWCCVVAGVVIIGHWCGRGDRSDQRPVSVWIETARRDRNGNRTGPPAPPPGLHTYVLLLCHPIITCSLGSML